MKPFHTDCIILGGGAAGLCACAALSRAGLCVTVVEKLDRVGKKIMAAGNGRCNISNVDMNPAYYAGAAPFVRKLYETTPPDEVAAFFSALGLMTTQEEGRIYPRTMMASSVLDVLRRACECDNVRLMTGCEVLSLTPSRRGGWSVQLSNGEGLFAPVVLCALGGSAAPHLGTDGAGVRLLCDLGHSASPLYPALVQLKCSHGALRSLKGVRIPARITLDIDGNAAAEETGELLFADYGVSGVCVFQLSRYAAKALDEKRRVKLLINLLPEIEDIPTWLDARIASLPECDVLSLTTGVFPRLLAQAICKQAGCSPESIASRMNAAERRALAQAISSFPMEVTGTQGFKNAQVTAGGISLEETNPQTMASALYDGLYLAGEVLDVDGPCGGYNLHFAFASALTAAKAILGR